jgi:hypothetical protein
MLDLLASVGRTCQHSSDAHCLFAVLPCVLGIVPVRLPGKLVLHKSSTTLPFVSKLMTSVHFQELDFPRLYKRSGEWILI